MKPIQLKKAEFSSNLQYLSKCLIGVIICYELSKKIPQYPLYWAIISVVIVLSPDNSNRLAYDRMKANILGCTVGLFLYPLHLTHLLILCVGVVLIIGAGIALRLSNAIRSAMAALVIVTLNEEETGQWYVALERVFCVVAGCLVALMVTLLFNIIFEKPDKEKHL